MKIKTIEELNDNIDKDFAWRKLDLINLKSNIVSCSNNSIPLNSSLRAGVTLLYAHWEGFIKYTAEQYLCYISSYVKINRLKNSELQCNLVSINLKDKVNKRYFSSKKNKPHIELLKEIITQYNERACIPYKDIIKTHSNLNSDVLKDIISTLGLDYLEEYSLKENLIDSTLLKTRNEVAHGNYSTIGKEQYFELHRDVLNLMILFKNQVIDASILEQFKKSS